MARKRILFFIFIGLVFVAVPILAWNLEAKHINALAFYKDGRIRFTLFDSGNSGPEFLCKASGTDRQWLYISPCDPNSSACLSHVDRMASLLLTAKETGRPVHVLRVNCEVTEVALKP